MATATYSEEEVFGKRTYSEEEVFGAWPSPEGDEQPSYFRSAARESIRPIVELPGNIAEANRAAMGRFSDRLSAVVAPGTSAWDRLGNVAGAGLEALGLPFAPVEGAVKSIAGDPLERATGLPSKYSTPVLTALATLPVFGVSPRRPPPPAVVRAEPSLETAPAVKAADEPALATAPKVADETPEPTVPSLAEVVAKTEPKIRAEIPQLAQTAPLTHETVTPEVHKHLAAAAKAYFAENPAARDYNKLVTDDIRDLFLRGDISPDWLRERGINVPEFILDARKSVTDSARTLAYYANLTKKSFLQKITPEEVKTLETAGMEMEPAAYLKPLWKRLDDVRRGALVTQISTSVRNFETQVGRVGLDVLQAPLDTAIQRLTGRPETVSPLDGWHALVTIFDRANIKGAGRMVAGKGPVDFIDQLLDSQPAARDRLLSNYLSDIANPPKGVIDGAVEGTIRGAESAVRILNTVNRFQEFVVRRGVFQATLAKEMERRGKDLTEVIRNQQVGAVPREAIEAAVHQAMKVTFADTPEYGTAARAVIEAVNRIPGATLAIPFPRFMYNALKFNYEYSPLGLLSYLSKEERAAFAAGNVGKMSKAILGSTMLAMAVEFRNSEYAGEKWYEARNAEGKIIDLRPYAPFSTYLFAADILKKSKDGELYKLSGRDLALGVAGMNLRAGTGLYLLDQMLNLVGQTGDPAKAERIFKELAGATAGGFAVPMAQLRDLYDEIDQGVSISRDTRQEPFLGPIKANIPGLSRTLPEAQSITRAEPPTTEHPFLLKQMTGIRLSPPKNAAEKELDRLGFTYQNLFNSTGNRSMDYKVKEQLGPMVATVIGRLAELESYKQLPDLQKAVAIESVLAGVRPAATAGAMLGWSRDELQEYMVNRLPPRLRLLVKKELKSQSGPLELK